jgi:hypothetical protein
MPKVVSKIDCDRCKTHSVWHQELPVDPAARANKIEAARKHNSDLVKMHLEHDRFAHGRVDIEE